MVGLEIHEASIRDAAAIARVHVDCWRTTYRGIIPDSVLDGLDYGQREAFWTGTISGRAGAGSVFVAKRDGGVIGFSSCGPERSGHPAFHAELYAIYVRESEQHSGVGRMLFDAVTKRVVEDGFDSMLLWVLERNPACAFYERMGGKRVGEKIERFGDLELREVAYGWSSGALK